MKIKKARFKLARDFPQVEFCCEAVKEIQRPCYGKVFNIDMDDVAPYNKYLGHCGQQLPYENGVMVISTYGSPEGYVPFDLIDIDEGDSNLFGVPVTPRGRLKR